MENNHNLTIQAHNNSYNCNNLLNLQSSFMKKTLGSLNSSIRNINHSAIHANNSDDNSSVNIWNINYLIGKELGTRKDTEMSISDSMINNEDKYIFRNSRRLKSTRQVTESRFEKYFLEKQEMKNKTQTLIDNLNIKRKFIKSRSSINPQPLTEFIPFSEIECLFEQRKKQCLSTKFQCKIKLSPIKDQINFIFTDKLGGISEDQSNKNFFNFRSDNINDVQKVKVLKSTGNLVLRFKPKKSLKSFDMVLEKAFGCQKAQTALIPSEEDKKRNMNKHQTQLKILPLTNNEIPDFYLQTNNMHFVDSKDCFTENLIVEEKAKKKIRKTYFSNEENNKNSRKSFASKHQNNLCGKKTSCAYESIPKGIMDLNIEVIREDLKSPEESKKDIIIVDCEDVWGGEEHNNEREPIPEENLLEEDDIEVCNPEDLRGNNHIDAEKENVKAEERILQEKFDRKNHSINDNTYNNYYNYKIFNNINDKEGFYLNNNTNNNYSNIGTNQNTSINNQSTKESQGYQVKEVEQQQIIVDGSFSGILREKLNSEDIKFLFDNANTIISSISNINTLGRDLVMKITMLLLKNINTILISKPQLEFVCNFLKCTEKDNVLTFINLLEIEILALTNNTKNLISLFMSISFIEGRELIFLKVINESTFNKLIFDKNGKELIEFLMESLYPKEMLHKLSPLINMIESNLVNYSISNFSTFIIQKYVKLFKSKLCFEIVKMNLNTLGNNRNGVFVISAVIESFGQERALEIADIIISNIMIFIKEKFASTLVEKVFESIPQSIDWFLTKKSEYLLEIIEDQYGNFVIQKLLNILSNDSNKKLCLLNLISFKLPFIKKKHIRKKWTTIVRQGLLTVQKDVLTPNISSKLLEPSDNTNYEASPSSNSQSNFSQTTQEKWSREGNNNDSSNSNLYFSKGKLKQGTLGDIDSVVENAIIVPKFNYPVSNSSSTETDNVNIQNNSILNNLSNFQGKPNKLFSQNSNFSKKNNYSINNNGNVKINLQPSIIDFPNEVDSREDSLKMKYHINTLDDILINSNNCQKSIISNGNLKLKSNNKHENRREMTYYRSKDENKPNNSIYSKNQSKDAQVTQFMQQIPFYKNENINNNFEFDCQNISMNSFNRKFIDFNSPNDNINKSNLSNVNNECFNYNFPSDRNFQSMFPINNIHNINSNSNNNIHINQCNFQQQPMKGNLTTNNNYSDNYPQEILRNSNINNNFINKFTLEQPFNELNTHNNNTRINTKIPTHHGSMTQVPYNYNYNTYDQRQNEFGFNQNYNNNVNNVENNKYIQQEHFMDISQNPLNFQQKNIHRQEKNIINSNFTGNSNPISNNNGSYNHSYEPLQNTMNMNNQSSNSNQQGNNQNFNQKLKIKNTYNNTINDNSDINSNLNIPAMKTTLNANSKSYQSKRLITNNLNNNNCNFDTNNLQNNSKANSNIKNPNNKNNNGSRGDLDLQRIPYIGNQLYQNPQVIINQQQFNVNQNLYYPNMSSSNISNSIDSVYHN